MIVRKFFSSAAQLMIASFSVRLLSLLTFPILTHLLSPEAYGIAALAATFIGIFTILGISGQDSSYVKCFHDHKNYDEIEVDRFYLKYAWLAGLFSGIIAMLVWLLYAYLQEVRSNSWVGLFVCLGVFGSVLSSFSQARARLIGAYKKLMWAIVFSGLTSTIFCILVAWLWRQDELALMVSISSYWIMLFFLPSLSFKEWFKKDSMPRVKINQMILIGLPLLATAPGYWIISSSDRLFLAANSTKAELGIYSVGVTVASLGQIVTSALCNAWYPQLSRYMHKGDAYDYEHLAKAQTLIIWLLLTSCFGICMFGESLIQILASDEFQGAAVFIPWVALGLMFYGINQFQGFGFTLLRKNHLVPLIWCAAVIFALCLNYTLVPKYHGIGAAFTQCASYLLLALITWWVGRKFMPFQPFWGRLFFCFIAYAGLVLLAIFCLSGTGILLSLAIKCGLTVLAIPVSLMWLVKFKLNDALSILKSNTLRKN